MFSEFGGITSLEMNEGEHNAFINFSTTKALKTALSAKPRKLNGSYLQTSIAEAQQIRFEQTFMFTKISFVNFGCVYDLEFDVICSPLFRTTTYKIDSVFCYVVLLQNRGKEIVFFISVIYQQTLKMLI